MADLLNVTGNWQQFAGCIQLETLNLKLQAIYKHLKAQFLLFIIILN